MADFFARLIARSHPNAPSLRPQKAARFASPQTVYSPTPSLTVSPPNAVVNDAMVSDTDTPDRNTPDKSSSDSALVEDTWVNSDTVEPSRQPPLTSTAPIVDTENTPTQVAQTFAETDSVQQALAPVQPLAYQSDSTAIAPPFRSNSQPTHHFSEPITTPQSPQVAIPQSLNAAQDSALPLSSQRAQATISTVPSLIPNQTVLEPTTSVLAAPEPSASEPASSVLPNTPLIQPTSAQLSQQLSQQPSPLLSSQTRQSQLSDLTGASVFKPTESSLTPSPRHSEAPSNNALDLNNSYSSVNGSQKELQSANLQQAEHSPPNPELTLIPLPSTEPAQEQPLLPTQVNIVPPSFNEATSSLPTSAHLAASPAAARRDSSLAPTIDITIGRIDIRASPPPATSKARPQARLQKASLSLSAYLNKREQR